MLVFLQTDNILKPLMIGWESVLLTFKRQSNSMMVNIYTKDFDNGEFSDTLSKEQRKQARLMMARQLCELLETDTDDNLYWMGSKTDLMDFVHEVFMSGLLNDKHGRPYRFKTLAKRACAVLHMPEPSNFYSIVYNSHNRKGIRQKSFFSRYCWLMYCRNSQNPINSMIKKIGGLNR